MDKKNPIAAMILSKGAPKGPADDGENDGNIPDGNEEGREAAADDMLQAIDKRDAAALANAIKSLVQMC